MYLGITILAYRKRNEYRQDKPARDSTLGP
jgi:hypothetical protein